MQNCVSVDGDNTACWPSGFEKWGRTSASQVFSPGHCPVGYTSAAMTVAESVTGAVCCLSLLASTCSMLVPIRQEIADSTEITGPVTMWAQPITIQWEEKDLSLFLSVTTTSASTSSSTSSSTTTSEITATSSISTSLALTSTTTSTAATTAGSGSLSAGSSSSGLSTGAGIEIGVGVGVAGVAGLAALALWFFMGKKRNPKTAQELAMTRKIFYEAPNGSYGGLLSTRVPHLQPYKPTELDGYTSRDKHLHELDS
ncbi:hypothetical protein N7490_004454 [Penicillium lividum]|nr:hypothetical protein N7490_004454 [Penicillium lividum]